MIPEFNEVGDLPVGGHWCNWNEIQERLARNEHRETLLRQFETLAELARRCGFLAVLIGGSFPTAKEEPQDMDLTWIAAENVTKESVRPECVKLMVNTRDAAVYHWDMLFLAIGLGEERIKQWSGDLGWDAKNKRERGVLLMELK